MLRFLLKTLLGLFLFSLLYLLACKWVFPPLTLTQLSDRLQSIPVQYQPRKHAEISPHLRLAVLAAEDQLFPDHEGFDWKALDASLSGKRKGKSGNRPLGGAASTLSQQTAKNVFLWQGGTYSRYVRKGLEAPYTWLIEKLWGKQRILDVYLNVAEMGPGIYGAEAAAQHYFGKPARALNPKEAAQLAACLPNPKIYTVRPLSRYVRWKAEWIEKQLPYLRADAEVMALVQ